MIEKLVARLRKLEEKSGRRDVILRYANGSQRSISIDDSLGLMIAAMRKMSSTLGPVEGDEDEGPRIPPPISDGLARLMRLVGEAESVSSDDNVVKMAHGLLRKSCGEEQSPSTSTQLNRGANNGF